MRVCGGLSRARKSLSHFFSTASPNWTSALAPDWQDSNTFIARSQPGAACTAAMMSSIELDLAGQTSADAGATPTDKTIARIVRIELVRIAKLPFRIHLPTCAKRVQCGRFWARNDRLFA